MQKSLLCQNTLDCLLFFLIIGVGLWKVVDKLGGSWQFFKRLIFLKTHIAVQNAATKRNSTTIKRINSAKVIIMPKHFGMFAFFPDYWFQFMESH